MSKGQIIALVGFVLILISIPLAFTMAKQSQIFSSKASELKKTKQSATIKPGKTVTQPIKEVPAVSPLSELLNQTAGSGSSNLSPTPATANLAFGPTLTAQIEIEGRPKDKQTAKVFIGIGIGAASAKPSYVLSFSVDFPASGIFQGLSLAGLNPGSTYTAYIKGPGQIDNSSTFAMSPTETLLNNNQALTLLSGDLNEDNTINSADYTIAKSLYGVTSTAANWNERTDFNQDGIINNFDITYIIKNFGKTGASGIWFSPIPTASQSATSSGSPSGSPAGAPSGGVWIWLPPIN